MPKSLPKTLYVRAMKDGSTEYFSADEDAASLVEMGETVSIGKYQLVEISHATGVAQFKNARRR